MEQNILQPVLNAFTRDETPANKYLGFIQEPLQVNIQGSSKKFLNRSTNIVLQIDHFELIAFSCDRKQENKVSYYNLILDWEVQRF